MSGGIKIVFGAAALGNPASSDSAASDFRTDEGATRLLEALKSLGVLNLDTAQLYGQSEAAIGRLSARNDFTIDTKWLGGFKPGSLTKSGVGESASVSVRERLKVPRVDVFYIHAPDATADLDEALAGIDAVHKAGLFERFGLSNFRAEDVRRVHAAAKAKGYVLPSVYQGNYSPVARLQDTVLFPTLRELGIAFYAYSPMAGGFLAKTRADVEGGKGRFNAATLGGMYNTLYTKPSYLAALDKWERAADDEGVSKAELAYRWVAHNSPLERERGDGLIIGARNMEQLSQTVGGINKGPLSQKAVKAIDDIWETIKHDAPLDNYHSFFAEGMAPLDKINKT